MKDFLKIWLSEKRDIFLVPLKVTEKYLFFSVLAIVLSVCFIDYFVFFDII